MWFGDLVTMRWWDDLWLNESFATFMSFLALDEATRFHAAWQRFNGTLKPFAYRDDQRVTTHPIAAEIRDTDEARAGVRRHHLREGRLGAQAAGGDHRTGRVRGRHPGVLPALRLGQRHARGLPCGTRRRRRAAARRVGPGLDSRPRASTPSRRAGRPGTAGIDELHAPPGRARCAPDPAAACHDRRAARPRAGGDSVTTQHASIEGTSAEVPALIGLPTPAFVFPNHEDHDYAKVVARPRVARLRPRATGGHRRPLPAPARCGRRCGTWSATRGCAPRSTSRWCAGTPRARRTWRCFDAVLEHAVGVLRRYVPETLMRGREHRAAWPPHARCSRGERQ